MQSWHMVTASALATTDCARSAGYAQTVHNEIIPPANLFAAGRAHGAYISYDAPEGGYIPFARKPFFGLAFGGYLCSVAQTIGTSPSHGCSLAPTLQENDIAYVQAEAPVTDPCFVALENNLAQHYWHIITMPARHSPYILFPDEQPAGQFYTFLQQRNAKEFRNLRAKRSQLEQQATLRFDFLHQCITEELAQTLALVELESWKSDRGIFTPHRCFETLALLEQIPLEIGLLYINDELIAWDIDIRNGSTQFSYNRSYKTAFSPVAAGKILHYEMLSRAWDNGVKRIELMGDADSFKLRIADGCVARKRFAAFSPGLVGTCAKTAFTFRSLVKRLCKGMPQ